MAFRILKRDLLALLKNPIALLVVGALLILPGLYAWYCIVANWDPYANTGNMPIAVVNEDQGASSSLAGDVDIGKQVTEKLQDNDSIDWRFYDSREEALEDTRTGRVYATLVLPENLSSSLIGIFEGSDEQPTVYYYPNEKYNAVATKVTDSAAQTLIRQVNQGFSSTVNEKILTKVQDVSQAVEDRADQANQGAIADVRAIQADLDQVIVSLDDATSSIAGWRDAATGASAVLAAASDQLPVISAGLQNGSNQLDALRGKTGAFEGDLSATVLKSAGAVSEMSGDVAAALTNATTDLKTVSSDLEALRQAAAGDPAIEDAIAGIELAIDLTQGIVEDVDSRVSQMNATVQEMTGNVTDATNRLSGEVMPKLSTGTYDLAVSFSKLSGAIGQFEPQIQNVRAVLGQTDSALATATDSIADAKVLLSTVSDDLKGTVSDIGAIGKAVQIEQLSELLDVDPQNVGTFVSSPVKMVTEEINPVSNYGTAVAPFYTNLALWIGCFILASLMKLEVDRKDFEDATPTQRYFGRWLLFVLLATLQSQVICGVDILLGIDCADPGYFMMAGFVCSFVYMNIIFALVITFRNIGKTLCILLLIMQVPGSSGMYPIEMMPQFFQFIHPALPFTYGIDAMREALSGMYGNRFLFDLSFLILIVPVALLLGLAARPALSNLTLLFDQEMSATGFFASEVHAQAAPDRVRSIIRALSTSDSMRDDFEERAWRFARRYPRLRLAGSVAVFVIPFLYLLIVLPFNLNGEVDINVKLGTLLLMVVVLLLVQGALIFLEYMHRAVSEQTRLMGLEILSDADFGQDPDEMLDLMAKLLDDDEPGDGAGANASAAQAATDASASAATTDVSGKRRLLGGPARDIFETDLRLGFQSVIGVVVVMLLVITPSMYAWFNIAGSWDPYSSTGNLKVAVANEDAGYKGDLIPITINTGDTLVSQLRGNDNFDWVFVGKDEAVAGVESSEYYAAIEIPEDFTANLMTYIVEDADYPEVIYYTNEKENPIAPIITQKGADSIQENIRVSFTERVDEVALSVSYDLLGYLTSPDMSSYVVTMSKHLDDATADTKTAARQVRSLSDLTSTVAAIVDTAGTTIDGMQAAGASAKDAVGDAKAGAENASAAFEEALQVVQSMLDGRGVDFDKIRSIADVALEVLAAGADAVPDAIQDNIGTFETLRDDPSTTPEEAAKCQAVIDALVVAKGHAQTAADDVAAAQGSTDGLISDTQAEIAAVKAYFTDTVRPSVDDLRSTISSVTASTSEVVDGLETAVAGLEESTGGLSNQLTTLSAGLEKAGDKLESSAEGVQDAKHRVTEALQSGDVKQVKEVILGGDPELMAASLAAPVQQEREAMYPISNYGSAMAPFYTVLSLWVGALVMISTMRVRVVEERIEELRQRYGKVRPRHEYFGRYGIFGFIGLLQSALVLLGDLFLLDIQCANPVLFLVCGLFIGQVFCLIVYTLTELFGDVGKALCVILLIMQVAASGGTFPAQMLDPLLLTAVPFLPFYRAMSLLQECVAGIYWAGFGVDIAALLVMAAGIVVAGVPLRRPFRKLNDFFEEQLEKTGYM